MQRERSTSWVDNLPVLLGTALAIVGFALVLLHGLASWGRLELEPILIQAPAAVEPEPAGVQLEAPAVVVPPVLEAPADAAAHTPSDVEPLEGVVLEIQPPVAVSASKRIMIPRIAVDSTIVDVALKNGEWPVPRFVVGHLAESVYPGDLGNAVFAGHLLSISSGNVFARLKELEVGDEMAFFADDADRVFRVIETKLVRNTDVSVLSDRPGQALVTLITCEGTWIQREQDYSHRRVVIAEAVNR